MVPAGVGLLLLADWPQATTQVSKAPPLNRASVQATFDRFI
jgi:hypothetical protein